MSETNAVCTSDNYQLENADMQVRYHDENFRHMRITKKIEHEYKHVTFYKRIESDNEYSVIFGYYHESDNTFVIDTSLVSALREFSHVLINCLQVTDNEYREIFEQLFAELKP